nr:hypothetical protein [Bacillus velezensis]
MMKERHQLFSNSRGQALSPNEHVAQFNSADISRRNHHLQMRRRSVSGFNPVLTIIVQQCRAIRHSRFRHDIKRLSQKKRGKNLFDGRIKMKRSQKRHS